MLPFISLCMIVKDEEKVLERCLLSVKHLVDEIIIVDTGSTDNTKEIASKYTSNIFDFTWINDFSAARNFASSKASGKWILVLDADEYIDEQNFRELIYELQKDEEMYDSYSVKIINFTGEIGEHLAQNFHDRIYRNRKEIKYYRKIHEQITKTNNELLKTKISKLMIFHSGYLNLTVREKGKNERNKELLDLEMVKGENEAFDYFNYGNEYSSIGEYEKALNAYLKAYKLKTDFRLSWVSVTLVQIVVSLINLKRFNDALNVIKDVESIYITSPELPYLKGLIYFSKGQLDEAKEILNKIITNNDLYNHIIIRMDFKDQAPHMKLAEIYLFEENYEKAIYHYTSVLNINKNSQEAIRKVIFILNKFHGSEEISKFLVDKNLIGLNNIKIYIKTCLDIGNPDLALKLIEYSNYENKLLRQVSTMKKIVIKKEGDLYSILNILKLSNLSELLDSRWINAVDLLLLESYIEEKNIKIKIDFPRAELEDLKDLLFATESSKIIREDFFLICTQVLINYQNDNLLQLLIGKIKYLSRLGTLKSAALLYSNKYYSEAMNIYEEADWSYLTAQDFLNIMDSLMRINEVESAVEVAKYAAIICENDYRFFKFILINSKDEKLLEEITDKTLSLFTF